MASAAEFAPPKRETEADRSTATLAKAASPAALCSVSLLRGVEGGVADASLVRCALRGKLPDNIGGRRKVLTVVLDRSGSMAGAMWRRVVEAVVGVVTDDLLEDSKISIAFIVYSDQAREVRLPGTAAGLRDLLLSREYSPQGGTSFKAAFELAQHVIERELDRQVTAGVNRRDIDVATLVFTDGEDTSVKGRAGQYGVRLVDKEASLTAARTAGDVFREALRHTGCPTYVCIAAFGADHNPDQCQYLSDRYYYINRGEALAEVLAGGLGSLLSSAGQCSVDFHLPSGVTLEERLPKTLPLDAAGCLDHHVWLRVPAGSAGEVGVDVKVGVDVVLRGRVEVFTVPRASAESFDGHLFLVDMVALQLRRVARELCGRGSLSADELSALRARLTDAKDLVQPTKDVAFSPTGQLRGRAALRERLAEVEAARERLSYALGQFDERDTNDQRRIGSVAIDAILRDAGQHVPPSSMAAALTRRADAAAGLPPPEPLSEYARGFTTDAYSCCDARELAAQGDALFFQLGGARPAPGGGFYSAENGDGLIGHEAFILLSRNGKQAVKSTGHGEGFTHLGLPLHATAGHFLRVQLLLPEILPRLTPTGAYQAGTSERQLLSLLGHALAAGPAKTESQVVALLHQARGVRAVLSATAGGTASATLLDDVAAEAKRFVDEAAARPEAADLHAVVAAGLVADGWGAARLAQLAQAVVEESFRRRVAHALRGSSDSQRLCLAWAMLGEADADDAWLDRPLPCPDAGELRLDGAGINPFTAPAELEELEARAPGWGAPRAVGATALLSILSSKYSDSNPQPKVWGVLQALLPAWGRVVDARGGAAPLWASVDKLMTEDGTDDLKVFQSSVAELRVSPAACMRAALPNMQDIVAIATRVCLPDVKPDQSMRLQVAADLKVVVDRRRALVCKYPITGADFPKLETHSGETVRDIWGASANPIDPALHHKAMLRVFRRTMKARITMTVKEALADKEYRKRGGQFAFPSPMDTFVRGLHRRTEDLHRDWKERLQKETAGDEARAEAVAEMLLRLRWDDSDDRARAKLSALVARIWDGLEGVDLTGRPPLSSALWLDDGDASQDASLANLLKAQQATADAQPAGSGEPGTGAGSAARGEAPSEAAANAEPAGWGEPGTGVESAAWGEAPSEVPPTSGESFRAPPGLAEDGGPAAGAAEAPRGKGRGRGKGKGKGRGKGRGPGGDEDGEPEEGEGRGRGKGRGGKGKGKGRGGTGEGGLDAGLRQALEAVPEESRRRVETMAETKTPGSRFKMPLDLSAKQRKALHLWVEQYGLEHRSFGYRGRRRLHVWVEGTAEGGEGVAGPGEDNFDYAAWAQASDDEGGEGHDEHAGADAEEERDGEAHDQWAPCD